jgi:putative DNA primase/helicase
MAPRRKSVDGPPSLPSIEGFRAVPERFEADRLVELLARPGVQADLLKGSQDASWHGSAARARLMTIGLYECVEPETPAHEPPPILGRDGKPLSQGNPRKEPFKSIAVCVRMDKVVAEDVRWLWPGRIPLRRVTGILARQGKGKSTLLGWLASQVSSGFAWPDVTVPNQAGSVVVLQGEEIISEDYLPRLVAMGADNTKIHVVNAIVRDPSGTPCHPNLSRDVEAIADLVDRVGDVRLLVVDPLGSYVSGISGYNDAEVRAFMAPLFKLAEEKRIAVVLFIHPSKDQEKDILDRAGNSSAFTQMMRMFWYYCSDPKNRNRRVLSLVKGNTRGATRTAISVGIKGDRLTWNPRPIRMDAFEVDNAVQKIARDERLTGRRGPLPVTKNRAAEFIMSTSALWPIMQGALEDISGQAGIDRSTFRRAFLSLMDAGKVVRDVIDSVPWFRLPDPPAEGEAPPEASASESG